MTRPLDRIAFGFVEADGMGVVATTFPENDHRVAVWSDRLKHHIRLQPSQVGGRTHVPARSLSYLEFDDGAAALLHRVDQGEIGRNLSHAVLGTTAELRPAAASLWTWTGWPQDPGTRLDQAELLDHHRRATPVLDQQCLVHQDHVIPMVRAVLLDPMARLSVLDAPDDAAPALVHLLRGLTAPLFEVAPTFSTYEVSDSRAIPDLPSVVFLKAAPAAGETTHTRLYLDDPPLPDRCTDAARALVARYVTADPADRAATYHRWLTDLAGSDPNPVTRAEHLVTALTGRAGPPPLPPPPPPVTPRPTPPPPPPRTRRAKRDWADIPDDRLVDEIAAARPEEVLGGVETLARRTGHQNPELRRRIRADLARHSYLEGQVRAALPHDHVGRWEATLRILRFAYGADGRDLAAEPPQRLPVPPNPLFLQAVHHLASLKGRQAKADELLGALVRQQFPPAPDLPAGTATAEPHQEPPAPQGLALRYRWEVLATTPPVLQPVVVLAFATAVLLLGLTLGLVL